MSALKIGREKRKQIRERLGFTRGKQVANHAAWYRLALGYHRAAGVLFEHRETVGDDLRPFLLNAALSLELVLKAVLAAKGLPIPSGGEGHNLPTLFSRAAIALTKHQQATVEWLTEALIWQGRYPTPNKESAWDEYHDNKLEKHIVRSSSGVMGNRKTIPTQSNCEIIWRRCSEEYRLVVEPPP